MSLSIKNRWLDSEDRVYIIFTVEEIAELMNCGTQKAVKLVKELDSNNGIGLIEKKRLGLGKPNVIYVKNFYAQRSARPKSRWIAVQICNQSRKIIENVQICNLSRETMKNVQICNQKLRIGKKQALF